jgi:hypothetical protein
MAMLAYFIAKYGVKLPQGRKRNQPPRELEGQSFDRILESFYPQLGRGRTLKKFVNSMKGEVSYFRQSTDEWLRKYRHGHPWLRLSRDELWSELQRLRDGRVPPIPPETFRDDRLQEVQLDVENERALAEAEGYFSPEDEAEGRRRILRSIALRRGQRKFRERLLAAYGSKCCMTGTTAIEVLEAAHIQSYSKLGTNSVTNGLLLRSDLHVLFDLFMVSVDPESGSIYCSQAIRDLPPYRHLHGTRMRLPEQKSNQPDVAALRHHYEATV